MTSDLRRAASTILVGLLALAAGCARQSPSRLAAAGLLSGPLISSRTTMVTAWEVPQNPAVEGVLDDSRVSAEIRYGFRIFTNTPSEAGRFSPSRMSCNHCHVNAGQRERALPLVGIAGMFPEYNKRSGRLYSLNDRIVDCFLRSENATGVLPGAGDDSNDVRSPLLPTTTSREVLAVAAYLTWLAKGFEVGRNPAWRGQNAVAASALIPVEKLDIGHGEALFKERCTSCHGADGQGVAVGDKKPGPLWGPESWNDGAGAARVYTLAGIIRYTMPYLDPGSLTDEEAQQLAMFIDSRPRPAYPFKQQDYVTEKLPPDSIYYPRP